MKSSYIEEVLKELHIDEENLNRIEKLKLSHLENISKEYFKVKNFLHMSEHLEKLNYGKKTLVVGLSELVVESPLYTLLAFCALPLILPLTMGRLVYKKTDSETLGFVIGTTLYLAEGALSVITTSNYPSSILWKGWLGAYVGSSGLSLLTIATLGDILPEGKCFQKIKKSYEALMINRRKIKKEKLEEKIKSLLK